MIFLLLSLITFLISLEIIADKMIWGYDQDDKPWTTIIRGILILIICLTIGNFYISVLLSFAYYFLVFDFALNVARWDDLPEPYDYKEQHGIYQSKIEVIISEIERFISVPEMRMSPLSSSFSCIAGGVSSTRNEYMIISVFPAKSVVIMVIW